MELNKYKNLEFHKNNNVNLKIKGLMLMLDHEVIKLNLSKDNQLIIIDKWIEILKRREMYEMIAPFKYRKFILNSKESNVIDTLDYEPYLMTKIDKIKSFFRRK